MGDSAKEGNSLFGTIAELLERGLILIFLLFLFVKCAIAPKIKYVSGNMTADTRRWRTQFGSEPPVSVSLTHSFWEKKNRYGAYVELHNRGNKQLFCHLHVKKGKPSIKSEAIPPNGVATMGGLLDGWLLDKGSYLLQFDGYEKKILLELKGDATYSTQFAK